MRSTVPLTWTLVALTICGCDGGSVSTAVSDPAAGVFAGKVLDGDGGAVVGARVSVDGVEADLPTDADGSFVVSHASLARVDTGAGVALATDSPRVSVVAPGFVPLVATLDVEAGEVATLEVVRLGLEPVLEVASPVSGSVLAISGTCASPAVTINGFVDLVEQESFLLDLVVVIDTSGSTERPTFDLDADGMADTVITAERSAVECLLSGLDLGRVRVAIAEFSSSASRLATFSADRDALLASLDALASPAGSTNFEAAFTEATTMFLERAETDRAGAVSTELGEDPLVPSRRRAVMLLTDGIPTTRGVPRDLSDDGFTQEPEDRAAAIEAALALGQLTGAELYAYSVASETNVETTLTTLPHCVAAAGRGRHVEVGSWDELVRDFCGESLVEAVELEVVNTTLGGAPSPVSIEAGGVFRASVPLAIAPDGSPLENVVLLRATAFPGDLDVVVEEELVWSVLSTEFAAGLEFTGVDGGLRDGRLVAERPFLISPNGLLVGGDLQAFLVSEFEDAMETRGAERFEIVDPLGGGATDVDVTFDFVFDGSCRESDVGWVVIDPGDPPSSHLEALADATSDNVLFRTGSVAPGCADGSIEAGTARGTRSIRAGATIAVFVLPGRTLDDYLTSPTTGEAPLFSIASLNPGRFDQVMSFVSDDGRTEPGDGLAVSTPGYQLVLGFEDTAIASARADHDFDDVVVTMRTGVSLSPNEIPCEP